MAAESSVNPGAAVHLQALLQRLPAWYHAVYAISTVVACLLTGHIFYTYGEVAYTLATIETIPSVKDKDAPFIQGDEATEHLFTQRDSKTSEASAHTLPTEHGQLPMGTGFPRYTTTSQRSTTAYLEREASSRMSRTRAERVYLLCVGSIFLFGWGVSQVAANILYLYAVGLAIGKTAFAGLSMYRTHTLISRPRKVGFWQRAHFGKPMRQILLPTLVAALANTLSVVLILQLASTFFRMPFLTYVSSETPRSSPETSPTMWVAKLVPAGLIGVCIALSIAQPADMALVRCQAALLAAEETPIVAFDRKFGGRVRSDGSLSLLAAWRSLDWPSYLRVLRVNLTLMALAVAVWTVHAILTISLAEMLVFR